MISFQRPGPGVMMPPNRTAGTFNCDRCGAETSNAQRLHARDAEGRRIITCRRRACKERAAA